MSTAAGEQSARRESRKTECELRDSLSGCKVEIGARSENPKLTQVLHQSRDFTRARIAFGVFRRLSFLNGKDQQNDNSNDNQEDRQELRQL